VGRVPWRVEGRTNFGWQVWLATAVVRAIKSSNFERSIPYI